MRLLPPLGALVAMLTLAGADPAAAQVGGLLRRAKDKAAEKAGGAAADRAADAGLGEQPVFDGILLELDEARVSKLVQGLVARREVATRGDLPGLRRRAAVADAEASRLADASSGARSRWEDSNGRVIECYDELFDELGEEHEERIRKRQAEIMRNPQQHQKLVETMGRQLEEASRMMADAIERGDEVLLERARGLQLKAVGIDLAADSVVARRKCGALPPKPAEVERAERARREADALAQSVRDLERSVAEAAVNASEMTRPQFAMAEERAELWLSAGGRGAFSVVERQVLRARADELRPLLRP